MSAITLMKRPKRPAAPDDEAPPPVAPIPEGMLDEIANVFRMLADPSRLKILLALMHGGRLHVTALKELLGPGTTQPAVSHHLTLMRLVNLIDFDRVGKHNFYYLAGDKIRSILERFFAATGGPCLDLRAFSLTLTTRHDD